MQFKLEDYKSNEPKLRYLFDIVIKTANVIANGIE